MSDKYYTNNVDTYPQTIYCYDGAMGESFIPEHHHNKGQFLYTEGGLVYVKIDQHTYYLPARHYIWIPPNKPHSIHPSSENVRMKNFYFPIDEKDPPFFHNVSVTLVNDLLMQLILYTKGWDGNIFPESEEYSIIKTFQLLLMRMTDSSMTLTLPQTNDEKLTQILNYINEHIGEKLTLAFISDRYGMSIRSLTRLFKKHLNMNFVDYITLLRMLRSIELLIDSDKSIKDIASIVGINSVPTFSNLFFKFNGIRPAAYRQLRQL